MGKKYIIETGDGKNIIRNCGKTMLAVRVAIGKTVGSINTGIELTPYTEPDLEQVKKEAYDEGYISGSKEDFDEAYLTGYNQGLADAWEAARKIGDMPYGEEEKAFGSGGWTFIEKHTAHEAIDMLKAYEDSKQELHIGDVVTFKTAYGKESGIVVDCHVPDVYSDVDKYIVWCGGRVEYLVREWLTKTGVHIPEITSILQKIKEMKKE